MYPSRLLQENGNACYHVVSRVVDRRFIFNAKEKNYFRKWMRRLEAFCGVQVLTFCLMSNHFHLLVKVPDRHAMPRLTKET
ncbi:MAG: transposase, partial [Verrucomicrobiales bacterium]|nr:transposase [Verrucomicrobiales bacterium]